MSRADAPLPARLTRSWALVWSAHGLGALAWWLLMPSGYPCADPHFWANGIVPVAVVVLSLVGLNAARRPRPALLSALAVFPPAAWASAATTALLLFPLSAPRLVPLLLGPALVLAQLTGWLWRRWPVPLPGALALLPGALLTGTFMTRAQQAPAPATRPLDEPMPPPAANRGARPTGVSLGQHVWVDVPTARVDVRCGGLFLQVHPLLTFQRRSPDRCWTLFASHSGRGGPLRRLTGWRLPRAPAESLQLRYQDDGSSALEVGAGPAEGSVRIEAHCRLDRPVYSHLNYWCAFTANGDRPLSLAFSPCPQERIAVVPWGDFIGGRLRLAYRAGDELRVAEASWNDKGPFHTLASGPLPAGAPLGITLYEGERPACELIFSDWPCQAGLALSPTAGYGLPVNAIEFSRYRASSVGCCNVSLSLAATSVGRGRDSVGHAPGTYRNRLLIRPCR
jgi:hypothetical protein